MNAEIIRDTHIIVHTTGEVDLSNVAEFSKALDEAGDLAPEGFILDLTDTTYIDSAGLQAILVIYRKMQESKGRFIIVTGNIRVKRVLDVARLEQLPGVRILESLDEARRMMPPIG